MKPDAYRKISQYRVREGQMASSDEIGNNGAFIVPHPGGATLTIIASDGMGWDHVSVSLPNRCPAWAEMAWVKDLFFEPEEAAMQLHPPKSEYVNCHPNCLHLWRPQNKRIPLPESILVGPKPEL